MRINPLQPRPAVPAWTSQECCGMEAIYERPADYDLEHNGDDEDVEFYRRLVECLRARRVLELACGSGRVTIPLATAAPSLDFDVVGVDTSDAMLAEAEVKSARMN